MFVEALDDLDPESVREVLDLYEADFRRLVADVQSYPSVRSAIRNPTVQTLLQRLKGDSITIGLKEAAKLVDMLYGCSTPEGILEAACSQVASGVAALRARADERSPKAHGPLFQPEPSKVRSTS